MKYLLIHVEEDSDAEHSILPERRMEYATKTERNAQLAHDKEFYPGKTLYTATLSAKGEIKNRKKA